jgi:methylmalonyl-CoA mutase
MASGTIFDSTDPSADMTACMTAWRRLVERGLGGRSFETLVSRTFEGLEIAPLAPETRAEGPRAFRRRPDAWKIAQRIDHPDPAAANHLARLDLENGADALVLTIADAAGARGFGTKIHNMSDLDIALDRIDLDRIVLRVDAGERCLEIADALCALVHARRLGSAALDIDFGHDPIGCFARSGALAFAPAAIGRNGAAVLRHLRDFGIAGRLFEADGRPYHETGAGEAQELACVLATGVAYMRLLLSNGLRLADARGEIAFLLAADSEQFLTLAKFRALRRLWARVESLCDLEPKPLQLHAETSFRMMSERDPTSNVFRTTMGAFAAAIGGADMITILPHTLAFGLPDEAARRLARNTQLVLIHETHLAQVGDPAAGSGAFETLTEDLCQRAWSFFQTIERHGGIIASLKEGFVQASIAEAAEARRAAIARRKLAIVGTSAFPDLADTPMPVIDSTQSDSPRQAGTAATCPALRAERDAEPFERLRAASDTLLARTGARPQIFIPFFRSDGSSTRDIPDLQEIFAIAGIEARVRSETGTPEEVAAAFRRSGCPLFCLCACDHLETTLRQIDALRAAGLTDFYIAASPELAQSLAPHAIAIITTDCDIVSILEDALVRVGAAFP